MATKQPIKPVHLLRRGEVMKWLGINEQTLEKWVDLGIVRAIKLPRQKSFYLKEEIERKLFDRDQITP